MTPRYSDRRRIQAVARFTVNDHREYASIRDLSLPGCLMYTGALLHQGQTLDLEIHVSAWDSPLSVPLAVVRWIRPPFAGLEFIRMSSHDQVRLRELVMGQMPSPAATPSCKSSDRGPLC
jgi:hypothetical protein